MSNEGGAKVYLITGFLGVGKTTSIAELGRLKPADERWAILVNEVGLSGIDGVVLRDNPALRDTSVATLPGGCICCTTQLPFQAAVTQIIKMIQPHRLFIEPTGMAETSMLLEALSSFELADAIDLQETVVLVDPRRACIEAMWTHPVFADQVMAADVVIGNRADQCDEAVLEAFSETIATRRGRPVRCHITEHGVLQPSWLNITFGAEAELPLRPDTLSRPTGGHDAHSEIPPPDPDGVIRWERDDQAGRRGGWVFPEIERFDRDVLTQALLALMTPEVIASTPPFRLKGIIACRDGRFAFNAASTGVDWTPLSTHAESAIEIIMQPDNDVEWGVVEALLVSATTPRVR